MNEITEFKIIGRRAQRIEVWVDGEPWLTLDAETVLREHLKKGLPLDEARRTKILATDEFVRARKAAAGNAARGPKTRRELEQYLRNKKFPAAAIEAALETLEQTGTVDDERIAGNVARSRRRRSGFGPLRIQAELRARGIMPDVAERIVEASVEGADLPAECQALARKLAGRYQPLGERKQRAKLAQALMRRGYDGELVRETIDRLCAELDCPAEE